MAFTWRACRATLLRCGPVSGPKSGESSGIGGQSEVVEPTEPVSPWAILSSCILWNVVLGVHFFVLTYVVPSFEAMFKEVGRPLPVLTQFGLNASLFVRSPIGILAAAAFTIAMTGGILWLPFLKQWKAIVFNLMAFGAFLLLGVAVVALFLPLTGGIIKSVGKPK